MAITAVRAVDGEHARLDPLGVTLFAAAYRGRVWKVPLFQDASMRDGETDQQRRDRRGEIAFIASCAAVFVVIAACAAYFVVKLLS